MSNLLLKLTECSLGYGRKTIIKSLDWQVCCGEHWAILGPNGAGKTTLLKAILGLLSPIGGRIDYFDDEGNLCTLPDRIGYLPQINQIDKSFPISVSEVVDSGMGLKNNLTKAERSVRIWDLLEQISLSEYFDAPIGQLSGGQLQRVLLARALADRPALLVLDEPMSFLDKQYREQFMQLLNRIVPKESTIIMVTHETLVADIHEWQELPIRLS